MVNPTKLLVKTQWKKVPAGTKFSNGKFQPNKCLGENPNGKNTRWYQFFSMESVQPAKVFATTQ
jgi:hypothetical protein